MTSVQAITHNDRIAAVVIGEDRIVLDPHITHPGADPTQLRIVQAKALYATQIHAGNLPGPYTDEDATLYAQVALEDTRGTNA